MPSAALTRCGLTLTERSISLQTLKCSPRVKIGHKSSLRGRQSVYSITIPQAYSEMQPDGSSLTIALVPAHTDLIT